MYNLIVLSILLLNSSFMLASYLDAEGNYLKPKLERNNIVNKGVWIKNKFKDNLFEKTSLGEFIFRPNSVDADAVVHNDFDAFGDNYVQNPPSVSSYVERAKRAANYVRKRRVRKSLNNCINCITNKGSVESTSSLLAKSKLLNDIKPTSVFNDYPYEVAILLNNGLKTSNNSQDNEISSKTVPNGELNAVSLIGKESYQLKESLSNSSEGTNRVVVPKRSRKHDYESEIVKKLEFTEAINDTDDLNPGKVDRNVFDKDDKVWHQNAGILGDVNVYKVVPKLENDKSKPVSERGLIKVISMLTKTFKKIMKQHSEIKTIHKKLHTTHEDFTKSVDFITNKFQDFEIKYESLNKLSDKLRSLEMKLNSKDEYFRTKESDMARNLIEFENQQKKFLTQQRQFYNVQKLMLAQNEKISIKQNLIAKTQSEISHRQNNFARILKKAKQMYLENKNPAPSKLSANIKPKEQRMKEEVGKVTHTTTNAPSTESIKINLFSIPISNKIENHDEQIMKEKDEQPIDDLVYKYYFNNTFIDSLMKDKVLSSFITTPQNAEFSRNAKNKRDELITTLLYPVRKESFTKMDQVGLRRERRWIHHHSRRKLRRKMADKVDAIEDSDAKMLNPKKNPEKSAASDVYATVSKATKTNRSDPFYKMALSFCNAIGQNNSEQTLNWCIEKSLRRLQFLDPKPLAPPSVSAQGQILKELKSKYKNPSEGATLSSLTGPTSPATNQPDGDSPNSPILTTVMMEDSAHNIFFPDNEELESNLKQFDIQPDTEGNFYYDGSLHASDIVLTDSEGFSDIMPGLDSNSRVDVDPIAFDLQARRRDYVRRLNEDILKNVKKG